MWRLERPWREEASIARLPGFALLVVCLNEGMPPTPDSFGRLRCVFSLLGSVVISVSEKNPFEPGFSSSERGRGELSVCYFMEVLV